MSDNSRIEWTDATWNAVSGCTKVSAGCDNCYAKTMHERFSGKGSFDTVTLHPDRLNKPLHWRRPRKVFVNSMSDLFHNDVTGEFIEQILAVIACAPQHTFQVLTKRHGRMRVFMGARSLPERVEEMMRAMGLTQPLPTWPLPNLWLGVSVENQQWADIRIPALLETPAAVRFLSCEPLLGPVNLSQWLTKEGRERAYQHHITICGASNGSCFHPPCDCGCHKLPDVRPDWVIVGGESGPGARPMYQQWARDIRDQCNAAGVPFLFKQWGEWSPTDRLVVGVTEPGEYRGEVVADGKHPDLTWRRLYRRVGKKAAGRELDGRTWDEYPAGAR